MQSGEGEGSLEEEEEGQVIKVKDFRFYAQMESLDGCEQMT